MLRGHQHFPAFSGEKNVGGVVLDRRERTREAGTAHKVLRGGFLDAAETADHWLRDPHAAPVQRKAETGPSGVERRQALMDTMASAKTSR